MILLSPHPDDLAFSIGGWLAAHVREARMMVLFTRSRWCPLGDPAWSVEQISAVRAEEDARFAARRGLGLLRCDFDDTSALGVPDFGGADGDARAGAVAEAVARAVQPGEIMVVPGGLGGHVDHQLTRNAALAIDPARCIFYEDLPYAASIDHIQLPGRAYAVDIDDVWAEKQAALALYRTQARPADLQQIDAHARRFGPRRIERLWAQPDGPAAAVLALTTSGAMV